MDEFCEVKSQDPSERNYVLHGVLVHSGDIDGGHYFALLKPEKDGKWFRFDDDRVTPVTLREVFQDNYGDDPLRDNNDETVTVVTEDQIRCTSARALKRFTNAYMLVYFQETKLNEILQPIKEEEIPKHLNRSLKDNAKQLKDDVLNSLMSSTNNNANNNNGQLLPVTTNGNSISKNGNSPTITPVKQKNISLKKHTQPPSSNDSRKCHIM